MTLKIIQIGLARIFPAPCSPTSQGSVWTPLAECKCKYFNTGNRIPIRISPKSYKLTIESRCMVNAYQGRTENKKNSNR